MASLFPENQATLPPFTSLLVQGAYHASAPILLALSHTHQSESDALFISPSRQAITDAMQAYHDTWLNTHSGDGSTINASARVKMLYPPTPAHLIFLLSSLEIPENAPQDRKLHEKTTLDAPPSLIILHELSAYFLSDIESNPHTHQWTLSSYLGILTQAMSTSSFLSRNTSTPFVLFDSHLDHLKLPIVKFPPQHHDFGDGEEENSGRTESVACLAQNFFSLVGFFDYDADPNGRRGTLTLTQNGETAPMQKWSWREKKDATGTVFVWS
ncbi:hypothetical protein CPB85DRAFT_309261 [Mucidula mucida]|nr:hypothetical protein CPB85DRAFT_309261 [Mucidula mucida]